MSAIDPRTVLMLSGLMGGLMSLVMFALKRNYPPSIKGLGEWSAALFILFVGGLLVAGRGKLPDFVAISVSSYLLWFGLYWAYVGTQRFLGVASHVRQWVILITAVSAVQVWFTLVDPNYHSRLVLTTIMSATLSGVHAWLIARKGLRTFARGMTLGVLMLLFSAQVLRLVTSFTLPFPADAAFFDTSLLQLVYITTFSFAMLLFSISAVLMATDRLRVELEHLAHHDSLTNAYTRRHMNEACRVELERCHRHGRKLCLMMIDMDHFKAVNDQHGHQAGDKVLIDFVSKVNALLRRPDQLGRFGGEEFVLLLPETTMNEALAVAERIRGLCAQPGSTPSCTVSIGVTTSYKDSETVDSLMARADAALYRAKANGRNRVESG